MFLERDVSEALLLELIETGTARYKDVTRLWLYRHFEGRNDNLLCVAALIERHLVVKE